MVSSGTTFNVKINLPCIIHCKTYILCDLLSRGHFKIAPIFDFDIEAVFYYISSIQIIPCRESRYNGSFNEIYIYGAHKFGLNKYQIPKELKSFKVSHRICQITPNILLNNSTYSVNKSRSFCFFLHEKMRTLN